MKDPIWKPRFAAVIAAFVWAALQPALAQESTSGSLAKALAPFVEDKSLAGAVLLVANKDKVLAVETVGYADVEAMSLMGPTTLFWIASQSKPITAAALMLLVEEGKVKLDDPVEKYLPEMKDLWVIAEKDKERMVLKRPKTPVTVRRLLNHTSGMPFKSALEQPTLDGVALRDAVQSYAMTPLIYEPGTKTAYSNAGINTAGRIIEVVSGMPYETFMDKRLFGPLGMKDTTFWPNEEQTKRLAKSYKPNASKSGLEPTTIWALQYPLTDRKRQPMPGGGLFSTAHDVGRFCRMFLAGGTLDGTRYLSEESVAEMTKIHATDAKSGFGVGWMVTGETYGHGGAFATNMTIDPKRGLATVFMVQHNGFPGKGAQSLPAFRKAALERFGSK